MKNVKLMTLFHCRNFFLLVFYLSEKFCKIPLNPGSSLNPHDGGERNDVNFECEMLGACLLYDSAICSLLASVL